MPQVTIYVDRDLAEQIRSHELATSAVCQRALRRAVRIAERRLAVARQRELDAATAAASRRG
jgi:post-segregation antitoxin (ccd killing protein)